MGEVGDYWRDHRKHKKKAKNRSGDADHCLQCGEWHGYGVALEFCSKKCEEVFNKENTKKYS